MGALRRCLMSKGYAETSLTDLAAAAQMSVSHLLYYYPSKQAILVELCDQVFNRIVDDVTALRNEAAEARLHGLVSNLFIRGAVIRSELGIMREISSLALHRPQLRERLETYERRMHDYLEDLFSKTPRQQGLSAADAAELAGALWAGFFNNVEFDARLSDSKARRLFRRSLFSLAGLPVPPAHRDPV